MTSPDFESGIARVDPYKDFRFKVKWDGNYVAGFSKAAGLMHSTVTVVHRAGDLGIPGEQSYSPITLERGVTHDVAFEQWANKVWDYRNSTAPSQDESLKDFRKDITIELFNAAGQKALAYNVFRCWVSEFQAMPELDGAGNAVAIETLTLQNEGWERDESAGPGAFANPNS